MKLTNWKILTTGAVATGIAFGGSALATDAPGTVDAIHLEDAVSPAWEARDRVLFEADGLTVGIDSSGSAASLDSVDSPDSPASPASPASVDSPDSPDSPGSVS